MTRLGARAPRPNGIDFDGEPEDAPTTPRHLARAVADALDADTAGAALLAASALTELTGQTLEHAAGLRDVAGALHDECERHGLDVSLGEIDGAAGYLADIAASLADLARRLGAAPVGQAVYAADVFGPLAERRPVPSEHAGPS